MVVLIKTFQILCSGYKRDSYILKLMLQQILSLIACIAFAFMTYAPIALAVDEKPLVDVQELFTSTKPIY